MSIARTPSLSLGALASSSDPSDAIASITARIETNAWSTNTDEISAELADTVRRESLVSISHYTSCSFAFVGRCLDTGMNKDGRFLQPVSSDGTSCLFYLQRYKTSEDLDNCFPIGTCISQARWGSNPR